MTQLDDLRTQIDAIDQQLISLLAQRLALVSEVGRYKAAHNLPPLDSARWQVVVESRLVMAKERGLDEKLVQAIFECIHEAALTIEAQVGTKS